MIEHRCLADAQPCRILAFPSRTRPAVRAIDPATKRAQWQAAFVAMAVSEAFTIAEDDAHLDRAVAQMLQENRASAMRVLRENTAALQFLVEAQSFLAPLHQRLVASFERVLCNGGDAR